MQSAPLGYMCCCKDHLEALLYNLQALPPGMDESSRGPRAACGLLSLLIPVHYVLRVCPWRPLPRNPGRLFFSHEVFCRGCSASFLQGGLASAVLQRMCFGTAGSQRVLTTSRDDTLRVWDGKKDLAQAVSIKHYNNTGRWVSPFRSVWGPAADTILCGSMKRNVRHPPPPSHPLPSLFEQWRI